MKKILLTTLVGVLGTLQLNAQTWVTQTSGTSNDLWGLSFVDAVTGWASGSAGTILATVDGGTTWTPQTSGVTVPILRNIEMFDAMTGWTIGDNGTILSTVDGGVNWTAQTSGVSVTLREASFISASKGWACGATGTILTTSDGGANWNSQISGTNQILRDVQFINTNRGYAVGVAGTIVFYNQPVITLSGVLTAFTTVVGTPSATQSFTADGMNLTANLDLTAPADFEISTSAGSGFGSSVSLTSVNSVVTTTTLYVRYNPSSAGIHSGVIDATSTGGITQSIAVNGASGSAGIDDHLTLNGMLVFPNPTSDKVTVSLDNESIDHIEVYNLSGQLIQQIGQLETNAITFSLDHLQVGSYLLQVYSKKGVQMERMIVQ